MTKGSYQQQVSLRVVGLLDRLHWNRHWGGGLVQYGDGLQIWAHFELKMNGSLNWRRHQKTLVDREFKSRCVLDEGFEFNYPGSVGQILLE